MAEPTKYTQVSTHDLQTPCYNSDDAELDAGNGIVKAGIDDDTKGTKFSDDELSDAEKEDDTGGTEHSPDAAPDEGANIGKEKTADSAITPPSPEVIPSEQEEEKTKENEESCWSKILPCSPCGPCKKKDTAKPPRVKTPSKYWIVRWANEKKEKAGKGMTKAKDKVVPKIKPSVPVIMALIGLCLMGFDQFSDIKTGYTICNIQCKCLWSIKPNGSTSCEVPGSSQSDDKHTKPCYVTFGNKEMIENFCTYAVTRDKCLKLESWAPNSTRHPKYCGASITTIVGPNIINSTYCLISLWLLYEAVFDYLEFSCLSVNSCFRKYFKFILLVLWPLQILPYIWMMIHLAICVTLCRSNLRLPKNQDIEEIRDKSDKLKNWEERSKTSKLIFTTLEDTPQLLLHSIFIVNSAITEEHSLVDQGIGLLNYTTCLSLASSSASIAFCLTVFKDTDFNLGLGGKLGHMLPSLISVGTRALVCSSYAASVVEDYDLQTWTVFLPPSIAIGLSIVENFPHMVKQTIEMIKKINKIIRSLKNPDKTEQFTNPITEDRIIKVLSFMFEAKDVWSISSSFTYLTFALALHTVWTTEFTSVKTRLVFVIIQYLALLSVIINMLMVQLKEWKESKVKWKGKILCLLYSIIFLLLSIGIYKWLNHPEYFDKYKKLYFPNVDPKTQAIKTYESFAEQFVLADNNEDVEYPHWFHLANIYIIISTAGVFVFVNFLMIVISFIRYRKNPPVESSQEDEKNPVGETSQEDRENTPREPSQEESSKDLNDIEMQEFSQQDSTSPKNLGEEETQKNGMV